jgi:hypothetical protein
MTWWAPELSSEEPDMKSRQGFGMPSLTAVEKRVHVTDSSLLPPQSMVEYDVSR